MKTKIAAVLGIVLIGTGLVLFLVGASYLPASISTATWYIAAYLVTATLGGISCLAAYDLHST
jgi:hypothetical protein